MQEVPRVRYEIVVPKTFDSHFGGGTIPKELLDQFRAEIVDVFHGITEHGKVTGYWIDPMLTERPTGLAGEFNFVLAFDVLRAWAPIQRVILDDILRRMCKELKQKAIHFTAFECSGTDVWNEDVPAPNSPPPRSGKLVVPAGP